MKVLYLINGLGTGGAERSLAEMLPGFTKLKTEVTVGCLYRKQEGVANRVARDGYDVHYVDGNSHRDRIGKVRELLKRGNYQLLHTTIFEANVIGRIASIGTPTPVLTSLVNTSYSSSRYTDPNIRPWKLKFAQMVDGWSARKLTDRFHAITEAVKQSAVHDLGISSEKITVVPRGRDAARLGAPSLERRLESRRRLGLASEAEVLINVGRQEFQKGQAVLLSAFEQVAMERPNSVLLIAGRTGHASAELTRIVSESPRLQEQVRFLGHCDDVPDLLAAADLFVFPSHYEGLGGAVLEAMGLGLPIVASDLPAIREIVELGENAVLVEPGNSSKLASCISQLLNDKVRRDKYGRRSREIFLSRFTLEHVVDQMNNLYQSMCRN